MDVRDGRGDTGLLAPAHVKSNVSGIGNLPSIETSSLVATHSGRSLS